MTILSSLRKWASSLKQDMVSLWIATRDPRVPWHAKLVAGAVVGYALSPIDLIPDFIPVLGYLDDVIIVPLGIMLAVRLIPQPLMQEFRREAVRREDLPKSNAGVALIAAIWIAAVALLLWFFWPSRSA